MNRIRKYFRQTKEFVSQKFPKLKGVQLFIGCPLVANTRRFDEEGYRAYMHTNHYPITICVSPLAEKLPRRNLLGLFLHEFGHLIGGGEEYQADLAILNNFGIEISYDNRKELQEV